MNKTKLHKIDEVYFSHQLDNGLKIIMISKKAFKTSSFYLGFPYGSLDSAQVDSVNTLYQDPLGIAHFLEHKLFENNTGIDIMRVFSALGAHVNAFTSHNETVYLFNSSTHVKKSLDHLLNFVFHLDITKESVEKEKGIIEQELRMYAQMPEQSLVLETFKSLYHTHPIRNDIGGTIDSVHAISKEALEAVYARNYHPANAVLVCVSPLSNKKLLNIIEKAFESKQFSPYMSPQRHLEPEPKSVYRPFYEYKMDIQASKVSYAFKLQNMTQDPLMNLQLEWTLRLFLELIFSSLNPKYQDWIENELIHDYFGFEVELTTELGFVIFFGESEDVEAFKTLIDQGLSSYTTTLLEGFIGLIRRTKSALIRSLNNHDDYAMGMMRSIFNRFSFEEQFEVLDRIKTEDFNEMHSILSNCDHSLVFMKKNREI